MDSIGSLFRDPPSSSTSALASEVARRHPGKFLFSGLVEMEKFLRSREGGGVKGDVLNNRVLAYLNLVFLAAHPSRELGVRTTRELRTIAEAIDALLEGDLCRVGDLLMQRFKAIETATSDGTWAVAKHLELIPPMECSVSTEVELEAATKQELRRLTLREKLVSLQAPSKKKGGGADG